MINFNTKLDLERQSKILSGHTAVFDGGVSFGIPFSGFPSGVDTGSTVLTSYNVITGETSGYSGTTGTTFFGITPVNPSAFTDSRIISGTTGLTSVITGTTSNYVQTYGPIWDLTSSTIIDEHLIGLSYSGYQITYIFNNVSASTPTTFDAYVNTRVDYYSANTLDYKGSTNWLTIKGNTTVDERLTVNRLTVTSGVTIGDSLNVSGNTIIGGSITKGSGTFRIHNPTPDKENFLYHSFVESPNAGDNIYRWSIEIKNGFGIIELPDYYHHLNENNQIWVNGDDHFGIGYGKIVENNLEIYSNNDGKYNVLLIGTRKDVIAVVNWKGVERNY